MFFLTKKAKSDLKNIARYTEAEWGRKQRDFYLKQLDESFHTLSKSPNIGVDYAYVRDGYRQLQVGRHFVFYRPLASEGDIEIVRILHERMNVEIHL